MIGVSLGFGSWDFRFKMTQLAFEQFSALNAVGVCRHVFTQRTPGIDVSHDKAEALTCLDSAHREIRSAIGMADFPVMTAAQVHGSKIAIVDVPGGADKQFGGCDGFITQQRKVALGIHVADCCAVYIVDPKKPAIGLVHSGKRGTELGVVTNAIAQMKAHFGSNPADLVVQLSPCIRPPHYEVDFAAEIIRQCRSTGVSQVYDNGVCTACHLDLYYSYRAEKGKTGRMLALLALL
jgi:copper oxidase (laccase) domain-containing protein